jgi:GTP-binding protein
MIIKNAEHEITAVKPNQYPVSGFPEVAFVGRSNVGKSSIINTLLNRKNLARVGQTPGKTRQINFYIINGDFYLVDLPGYGFANVSKDLKASWENIIETYLYSRKQNHLKLVIMLVDIRHSPSKDDIVMHQWIKGFGMRCLIVATKADKIPRSQINVRLNDIRKVLQLDSSTRIIPFSAEKRTGKEEVLEEIGRSLFEVETAVELSAGDEKREGTDKMTQGDQSDKKSNKKQLETAQELDELVELDKLDASEEPEDIEESTEFEEPAE